MNLEKSQIRELMIWVHPGHCPVGDDVIQSWRDVIDVLQYEPRTSLIETTMVDDPDRVNEPYLWPEVKDIDNCWNCRVPYGQYVEKRNELNGRSIDYMRNIGQLEELSKQLLDERYVHWPHGNFINGRDRRHIEYLKEVFNLEEDEYGLLVREISCYGLLPDTCVEWQWFDFGLQILAPYVKNYKLSPDKYLFNLATYGSGEDFVGRPSTRESLRLMSDRGILRLQSG